MEATSISGLEAMGASLPLIGTKSEASPELIREGINGVHLCEAQNPSDLAQKIDTLLAQDFKAMGEHSLEIVTKDFDWDIIAKATMKEYRGLL